MEQISALKSYQRRGVHIFYPTSLYVGILVALVFCFTLWKLHNLGKYRIPLFIYGVVMQSAFLISFAWIMNYFRTTESLNRDYYDVFGNGVIVFYWLLIVPFIVALCIQVYKGIWKLEVTKNSKIILLALFILLCLVVAGAGFYLHVFFYYGFAP